MSNYIPTPAFCDRMPVDISFIFEGEKPAGKHGFLRVDGDDFRFEDGTVGKFWGVMFNGGANFPEHSYSDKVARRLGMAGVNIVRLHQLDAEWGLPNIYQTYAGPRLKTTRVFSPESMERLDYLIYALKKEGIYLAVDMQTYRKFKSGDGVKFADLLSDIGRGYSIYDPTMIELQKEFCVNFWSHYNPYTQLCYKDDPVFVMCTIQNENDLFTDFGNKKDFHRIPYYDDMFRDMFDKWLRENGIDYDAYGCPLFIKDKPMIDFKTYLTERFYSEMLTHLRSIGVKIPVTGTNWVHADAMVKASSVVDFTDNHRYVYDWHWGENEKVTKNIVITDGEPVVSSFAKSKLHRKPVFFSEWDVPWPNAYRAEGVPYFAAVACLQDWSGMTVHTYSYGTHLDRIDRIGKESVSSTIGSVPYREGIFSVWNDPAKFGLFYHASLMLRRGDVRPAEKRYGILLTDPAAKNMKACSALVERSRVATVLEGMDTSGLDEVIPDTAKPARPDPNRIESDTGELWRDLKRSIGAVDSPRTKILYGFLGRGGSDATRRDGLAIELGGMSVDCYTDFGVIALSSLTDEPIAASDNILLSAIGRARNTGAQFDGEKLIDFGHSPIISEVIEADIFIRTDRKTMRVWGINSEGYYVGMLDTAYEDGVLSFHIGPHFPAQYYLIQEE